MIKSFWLVEQFCDGYSGFKGDGSRERCLIWDVMSTVIRTGPLTGCPAMRCGFTKDIFPRKFATSTIRNASPRQCPRSNPRYCFILPHSAGTTATRILSKPSWITSSACVIEAARTAHSLEAIVIATSDNAISTMINRQNSWRKTGLAARIPTAPARPAPRSPASFMQSSARPTPGIATVRAGNDRGS